MTPTHIAIIMDGNGRWAQARGKPRLRGHEAGVETVRRVIRAARRLGVRYLTLYAFSVEYWSRPSMEVRGLMGLLERFLAVNEKEFHENKIRLRILGRRTDLPPKVDALLAKVEAATAHYAEATLVLALSYGGRTEIAHAAQTLAREVAAGFAAETAPLAGPRAARARPVARFEAGDHAHRDRLISIALNQTHAMAFGVHRQ